MLELMLSGQKQEIPTTIPLPYYLKFYSIKYEIQDLASSWLFFWEAGTEVPPASVYSAQVYITPIHMKIIICSHYSTDSQEQYENSLGNSCESHGVFMRAVSFKRNLQCYSYWITFGDLCSESFHLFLFIVNDKMSFKKQLKKRFKADV